VRDTVLLSIAATSRSSFMHVYVRSDVRCVLWCARGGLRAIGVVLAASRTSAPAAGRWHMHASVHIYIVYVCVIVC
jgi:hypothetical protein